MSNAKPRVADTDDVIAEKLRARDTDAFAMIYDQYFQSVYDFCLRTVRDSELAADAVQTAFVRAWENPPAANRSHNIKAWLFTIARNVAIDELRKHKQVVRRQQDGEEDIREEYVVVDESRVSDPQMALHDSELVGLVWEAAQTLKPREYALLDMHMRQDLSTEEIAEELGVAKGNVYTMLSRLRASLDQSVRTILLIRRGQDDCTDLRSLLANFGDHTDTPEETQLIQRHVDSCMVCNSNQSRFVSPSEIFAGLSVIAVVPGLRSSVWDAVVTEIGGVMTSAVGGQSTAVSGVAHTQWWFASSVTTKVALGVATVTVAGGIAVAAVVVSGSSDSEQEIALMEVVVQEPVIDVAIEESTSGVTIESETSMASEADAPLPISDTEDLIIDTPNSLIPLDAVAYAMEVRSIIELFATDASVIMGGETSLVEEVTIRHSALIDRTEYAIEKIAALLPPIEFINDQNSFITLTHEIVTVRRELMVAQAAGNMSGIVEIGDRLEEIRQKISTEISPPFLELVEEIFVGTFAANPP